MKNYNEDLYILFNEIADLMSILNENVFKIRAYRQAAIRLKEQIRPITKKTASKESFKKIPGIGDAIAEKMMQYIQKRKIDYLETLRHQIPKDVRDLLEIPHLGPSRVRDLYINLGVKSKADLKKCAESGRISELRGFGDKLVGQILEALKTGQEKKKRHDRKNVKPIADKLVSILKKIKGVKKVEVAGSYRRQSPTVGDVDILVCGKPVADKAEKSIKKEFTEITMLGSGETKIAFMIFPDNLQVDIRFVPEESYGAALLYFTGSKDYNVMMRKAAIEKGYLLNEYGLFENGEYIAGETEESVCEKLGLPFLEPRKRK
jgi:DNA polymerase (family 10)